jgi:hypothetical protein
MKFKQRLEWANRWIAHSGRKLTARERRTVGLRVLVNRRAPNFYLGFQIPAVGAAFICLVIWIGNTNRTTYFFVGMLGAIVSGGVSGGWPRIIPKEGIASGLTETVVSGMLYGRSGRRGR